MAGLPTVTEPGDDGMFAAGDRIVAEVAFDAPVTVDTAEGSPVLGLALGGVRRDAAYAGGSGTAVLSFVYTAVEDDDGAGEARAISNGLVLNGATIRGEDGTDAVLEFGEAPRVASVRIVPPGSGAGTGGTAGDGAWDPGEALKVALVFEEPVEVETSVGTPSVDVLLGAATKQAAYVRGSGTDRLVFSYTLVEADGRATSALVPGDTLALDGGAIRSTAGLDATLGHPGGGYAGAARGARGGLPVLSVADAAAAEGGTLAFTVTLAPAASGEVTVDWATADGPSPGGATAGSDYTAGSGTLTFAAGETEKTVEVAVADDAEEAPETLTLTLSNPSGARLGDGEATGTVSEPGAAPLTGSFSGAPPEHDGTNAFLLTLAFSAEPAGLSYKTVRDTLFTVTGATLKQARRLSPPSNERYELKLAPGGNAAVTLELAALPACGEAGSVCTADDGRALAGPLTVTVPGPAALSVADASVDEGPGAVLDFAVTLDRERHAAVTVDYATSDETATAGSDYTATSGTLTFGAGETSKTVSVPVADDSHDDDGETLTLTLSNASGARIADGEATGTINNSDAIPKAWIARFGRTVPSFRRRAGTGNPVAAQDACRYRHRSATARWTNGASS